MNTRIDPTAQFNIITSLISNRADIDFRDTNNSSPLIKGKEFFKNNFSMILIGFSNYLI